MLDPFTMGLMSSCGHTMQSSLLGKCKCHRNMERKSCSAAPIPEGGGGQSHCCDPSAPRVPTGFP